LEIVVALALALSETMMFGNVFKAFTHRQKMNSDSSIEVDKEDLMVLIDHVPEALLEHNDEESFSKDANATPETQSILTETDDSLLSGSIANSPRIIRPSAPGQILPWCGKKYYSDFVREGLASLWQDDGACSKEVIMIYESPATAVALTETSFFNDILFQFHDYPLSSLEGKTVVGPLRYSCMTGDSLPVYLQQPPPAGLVEHWSKTIPDFTAPTFCHEITKTATICAYLPLESLVHQHMIDPHVHYELAGKDAIPYMSEKTTRLLPDTQAVRPCVVKVTHAMGSRGIFVIRNDEDEKECFEILDETGGPNYVVTDFVDIVRNLAAHFFIHPSGDVTWFGSSENLQDETGAWSSDATIRCMDEQDELRDLMAPYVQDVAQYCLSRGYWGACGIDVLIDRSGEGFVVDVNPRVTGSCPALMAFQKLHAADSAYALGTFRRSSDHAFPGPACELLQQVEEFNATHDGELRVVVFSFCERAADSTELNIGVFGSCQSKCLEVLNHFAPRLKA
jgi:hypothetical protein